MRAFVVIASLVALACADVSHLYDAPYKTNKHTVTHTGFGGGFTSDPVVNFVPTTTHVQHNYVKPAVVTTGQYVADTGSFSTGSGFGSGLSHGSGFGSGLSTGSSYGSGLSTGSGFGSGSSYGSGLSTGSGFGGSYSTGNSGFGVNSGFGGVNGGSYHDSTSYGGGVSSHSSTTLVKQTAPIVSKSTYVFAAPEDREEIQRDQTIVLPRPRQHYKVIFIKAPSTTIVNHPSTALGQQTQEKTLVYVLSDKKRIENHVQVPEIDQVKPQKPEVFFIKHNSPTKITNTHVKYETVDAVNGAENGAVNGVPNRVSGGGFAYQDEASNPQQAHVAQSIYQAVQSGGVESGVQTVDKLIAGGHSVSGNFNSGSGANYDTTSTVYQPSTSFSTGGYSTGLVQPSYSTGQTYTTGLVQPSYSTGFVQQQPATVTYGTGSSFGTGSGSSGLVGGSYGSDQGYNYGTSGTGTSYSQTASGCSNC